MNIFIIAYRDPTEKDNVGDMLLWWNKSRNRFFIRELAENGKIIWKKLIEDEKE